MKIKYVIIAILAIAAFLICSNSGVLLKAEEFPSGIRGRVTTSDGALVTGVEIKIVERKTKQTLAVKTDKNAEYSVQLRPGIYDISVEYPSWKPENRKNIKVAPNAKSTVDFVLRPGKPVVFDENHP
jgi:hypothetical protein